MAGRPYDYVALTTIYYGGSRAYNPGDPVPAANVEKHGYEIGTQVAEYGTDEARRVTGQATDDQPAESPAQPGTNEPPAGPVAEQQPAVPKPSAKRPGKPATNDEPTA